MNLTKLFEIQKELDRKIIEKKGLEGRDLLPERILALQVELGECANEWRGFKFWSEDREPRTKIAKPFANDMRGDGYIYQNPLLEEYVDCLHFILSIGLEVGVTANKFISFKLDSITDQFIELNYQIYRVKQLSEWSKQRARLDWVMLFDLFMGLGEMLGFSPGEIEDAYLAKNEVNHERQVNGY
ncbi:hypothetical protein J26TS2_30430 [Shouchella clausii]|nr:hypothetical protein J26TS2_30430 [Shouchella clausii]